MWVRFKCALGRHKPAWYSEFGIRSDTCKCGHKLYVHWVVSQLEEKRTYDQERDDL